MLIIGASSRTKDFRSYVQAFGVSMAISGDQLAINFLNNPEKTEDTKKSSARWYRKSSPYFLVQFERKFGGAVDFFQLSRLEKPWWPWLVKYDNL